MKNVAGKYYVGDLCYVLGDKWDEVCEVTITKDHQCLEGGFQLKDGTVFTMFGTAWGDGEYQDQEGNSYGVDSGTIGCVSIEYLDMDKINAKYPQGIDGLGKVHDFPDRFDCYTDGKGKLTFGHVVIDTDPPYEEEPEDY